MRTKFQDFEVAVIKRMKKIFDQVSERRKKYSNSKFKYKDVCIEDSEEADVSIHFMRNQKSQHIGLKKHLERYVGTLPVFGFNSGRFDLTFIKYYLTLT